MSNAPRRALIVIDVQNEYVSGNLRIQHPPVEASLTRIGQAMDAAHRHGVPIVVVHNHAPAGSPLFEHGSHGWQLHEVVTSRPHDHLVTKTMPSAFADTGLQQWLTQRGVDTLAIAGYMTHNCDASTIVHATHADYHVEFLADASGTVPYSNAAGSASAEEIHRVFSVVFHSRFAAVTRTDDWVRALEAGVALTRGTIHASHQAALAQAR